MLGAQRQPAGKRQLVRLVVRSMEVMSLSWLIMSGFDESISSVAEGVPTFAIASPNFFNFLAVRLPRSAFQTSHRKGSGEIAAA